MKNVLLILILSLTLINISFSQIDKPDSVRIERLAALGKLWGTIKYFHPYLAYKTINWDSALVQAIPKVNAANNKTE